MTASAKGFDELAAKLARLDTAVQGEALENALVAGAMLIVNEAKMLSALVTGTQMRSIHIGGHTSETSDFARGGESPYSDIGRESGTKHDQSVRIGTNVAYAKNNEYKHKPFMRPAYDSQVGAAKQEIVDALKILIDTAAK